MEAIVIVVLTILLSAFFSGVEIAFLSSNKFHIELENKKGNFSYKLLSFLSKRPSRFIAALLIGNNIALVVYGLYMPQILESITHSIRPEFLLLISQTLISTIFILFLAEFFPKVFFNSNPDQLLKVFAFPAYIFYWLFYPVVSLVMTISNAAIRLLFRGGNEEVVKVFDRVDLNHYIRESTEKQDVDKKEIDTEIRIFQNALDFRNRKAREFMVPRTEIVSIDENASLSQMLNTFVASGLSKILVHQDSVDEILGYVHSYEIFKYPENLKSVIRPISFIPESMTANDILKLLLKEKRSIAVVLDEFGATSGLITIEDVVEELFGEIDDEHDVEKLTEQKISDNEYLFSARLEINYLNEEYRLDVPMSENYNTLGGWIMYSIGSIPEKGERYDLGKHVVIITKAEPTRVDEVRLRVQEDES